MLMRFFSKNKLKKYRSVLGTSIKLFRLVWEFDKKFTIIYVTSVLLPGFLPFLNALIYAEIINQIVKHISSVSSNYNQIYILVAVRFITLIVQNIANTVQNKYSRLAWGLLPRFMSEKVLESVSKLDLEYFEDSKFNDKLERVRDSFSWRPINMFNSIIFSLQNIIEILIAALSLMYLNWLFAVLILISAIPTLLYQMRTANIAWAIWEHDTPERKRYYYLSQLIQSADSVKELKLFKLTKKFLSDIKKAQESFIKKNEKALNKSLKYGLFATIFSTLAYIIIELSIIIRTLHKSLSLGGLTYFTQALVNYQGGINSLFSNLTVVYDFSQYIAEIFEVIETKPKIVSPKNPIMLLDNQKAPEIEFKNVSFCYPGTKKKVFDNLSIKIESGKKIAFVGENGAGKTTLVKLLSRFYDIDDGAILIDGIDLRKLDLEQWHSKIGVLFQDFLKYEYTLEENIHFGKIEKTKILNDIIDAAKKSGADKVANKFEDKYSQQLGKIFDNGTDLSIGQWQKVALARGFYRDSDLLILDEPTAAIDAKAESEIFEKVKKISLDRTVLIISHRFSTVRNADKIYVLDNGKIKEQGSHHELMKNKGIYAELFNLQAEAYR